MYDAMTRYGRVPRTAALRWLVALPLLAGTALVGGEPPAPETAKKPVDEKPFVFEVRNRRDPFCFRRKPDIPTAPGPEPIVGKAGGDDTKDIDQAQVEKRKADSEKAYTEAESAFLEIGRDGRAPDIIAKCDVGLDVLKDVPNIAKYPELLSVREKLLDLRRAADNMRLRQIAEKKVGEMNIRLTGVVFRDRHSRAIVNGKPVGRGAVVAVSDSNEVIVDEIKPDQVVFVFQGYKMMLTLSDMAQAR
jgi:hypothetical protein